MAKVKKEVKKEAKVVSEKVELERKLKVIKDKEEKESLIVAQKKYDDLVKEIVSSNLLTNAQLKKGGEEIRQKHGAEVRGFTSTIDEINLLGKKLGKPEIGLGHLRRG